MQPGDAPHSFCAWTMVAGGPIVRRIEWLLTHGPDMNPIVAYVALPIAVLPLLLGIVYWRIRGRKGASAGAARWGVAAAALTFVAWAFVVVQQIAMSESSTAFLAIIVIGPFGLLFAAVAFVVVWGLAVLGQWMLAPSRRRPAGWTRISRACGTHRLARRSASGPRPSVNDTEAYSARMIASLELTSSCWAGGWDGHGPDAAARTEETDISDEDDEGPGSTGIGPV